jgi:hypothetical protein
VTCLGHFHTLIPHRRYVVNGSLIGVDPYSIKCGFEPELAAQAFFMVDKRFGAHSWAPVWCQRPQDAEEWGYQPVRAA